MDPQMDPQQDVAGWITKTVNDNDVVLFMKGNKQMPQCGFSAQVAHILSAPRRRLHGRQRAVRT